jgi:hypothetical protein
MSFESNLPPLTNQIYVPEREEKEISLDPAVMDLYLASIETECQCLTKLFHTINRAGLLPTTALKKLTFGRMRDIQSTIRFLRMRLREKEKEDYKLRREYQQEGLGAYFDRYVANKGSKV